jgi:hypothetical protein
MVRGADDDAIEDGTKTHETMAVLVEVGHEVGENEDIDGEAAKAKAAA